MARKSLIPTFTENADLQAALAKRYATEQGEVKAHMGHEKLGVLSAMRGLQGENFRFAVSQISYAASNDKEDNGYRAPVGGVTVTLNADGQQEKLVVSVTKDGLFTINAVNFSNSGASPAKAANVIEGWRIDMEEKYGFDATTELKKKAHTQVKSASGGARPEKK